MMKAFALVVNDLKNFMLQIRGQYPIKMKKMKIYLINNNDDILDFDTRYFNLICIISA